MATKRQGDRTPQFHIRAPVFGPDGLLGHIDYVVVDPKSGRVLDLVVALQGERDGRSVVLPVTRAIDSDASGTRVDLSPEELQALPDFEEVRFESPDEAWPGLPEYTPNAVLFWAPRTAVEAFVPPNVVPEPHMEIVRNVPEGAVVLSASLDACCNGDVVGHVDRVLVDPDAERATHLVIRQGMLGGDEHVVPVSHVRAVTETTVDLDCHGKALDEFPRYRG